jgi:N-acetylglucosaminyl-diphospho-decaprenol L-rhamnosyltransferase
LEGLLLAVAAVIVTWNSEQVVQKCLEALAKVTVTPTVVDNASSDLTVQLASSFPDAQVIANAHNRGFAAAVNQGIGSTSAEFILLLNPDVQLLTSVDALVQASRQHGLAAGKLVDSTGKPQTGFTIRRLPTPASLIFELFGINRLWPDNPVNRRYRCLDRDLDLPGPVEQPAGAFLMTRRDVWDRLGGFDENFQPVWFEDVDYCRRALDAGYQIEYVPSVLASHTGGHSVRQVPAGCQAVYWCVSLLRYAAKHFRSLGYRSVCAAVLFTSVPRMFAGMIRDRSFTSFISYIRIIHIAGQCLFSDRRHGVDNGTDS